MNRRPTPFGLSAIKRTPWARPSPVGYWDTALGLDRAARTPEERTEESAQDAELAAEAQEALSIAEQGAEADQGSGGEDDGKVASEADTREIREEEEKIRRLNEKKAQGTITSREQRRLDRLEGKSDSATLTAAQVNAVENGGVAAGSSISERVRGMFNLLGPADKSLSFVLSKKTHKELTDREKQQLGRLARVRRLKSAQPDPSADEQKHASLDDQLEALARERWEADGRPAVGLDQYIKNAWDEARSRLAVRGAATQKSQKGKGKGKRPPSQWIGLGEDEDEDTQQLRDGRDETDVLAAMSAPGADSGFSDHSAAWAAAGRQADAHASQHAAPGAAVPRDQPCAVVPVPVPSMATGGALVKRSRDVEEIRVFCFEMIVEEVVERILTIPRDELAPIPQFDFRIVGFGRLGVAVWTLPVVWGCRLLAARCQPVMRRVSPEVFQAAIGPHAPIAPQQQRLLEAGADVEADGSALMVDPLEYELSITLGAFVQIPNGKFLPIHPEDPLRRHTLTVRAPRERLASNLALELANDVAGLASMGLPDAAIGQVEGCVERYYFFFPKKKKKRSSKKSKTEEAASPPQAGGTWQPTDYEHDAPPPPMEVDPPAHPSTQLVHQKLVEQREAESATHSDDVSMIQATARDAESPRATGTPTVLSNQSASSGHVVFGMQMNVAQEAARSSAGSALGEVLDVTSAVPAMDPAAREALIRETDRSATAVAPQWMKNVSTTTRAIASIDTLLSPELVHVFIARYPGASGPAGPKHDVVKRFATALNTFACVMKAYDFGALGPSACRAALSRMRETNVEGARVANLVDPHVLEPDPLTPLEYQSMIDNGILGPMKKATWPLRESYDGVCLMIARALFELMTLCMNGSGHDGEARLNMLLEAIANTRESVPTTGCGRVGE